MNMTTTRVWAAAALSISLGLTAFAQSEFAGKWAGDREGEAGVEPVILQVTTGGSAVTGTVTVGQNPTQQMANAVVKASRLTFVTTVVLNGKEVPMSWDGELLKNGQLRLIRTMGSRPMPALVLQRAK
jgi:hypothetical protein